MITFCILGGALLLSAIIFGLIPLALISILFGGVVIGLAALGIVTGGAVIILADVAIGVGAIILITRGICWLFHH